MVRITFCLFALARGWILSPPTRRVRPLCRQSTGRDDEADEAIADLLRRAQALSQQPGGTSAPDAAPSPEDILAARRREAEALAARLTGEDIGDEISGRTGRAPVPSTDRPAPSDPSKWPKFAAAAAPPAKAFGGAFDGPAPREPLTAEAMDDPELQSLVRRQMVAAFDNLPPRESETYFARLWAQGPIKSVRKLVDAARDAADVEKAYFENLLTDETAGDEIRVCRSRIRMYGKDGEFLPNPDGSPAADMWGSLDDWMPWRWRP